MYVPYYGNFILYNRVLLFWNIKIRSSAFSVIAEIYGSERLYMGTESTS